MKGVRLKPSPKHPIPVVRETTHKKKKKKSLNGQNEHILLPKK